MSWALELPGPGGELDTWPALAVLRVLLPQASRNGASIGFEELMPHVCLLGGGRVSAGTPVPVP